jgi:hypothetical protein
LEVWKFGSKLVGKESRNWILAANWSEKNSRNCLLAAKRSGKLVGKEVPKKAPNRGQIPLGKPEIHTEDAKRKIVFAQSEKQYSHP